MLKRYRKIFVLTYLYLFAYLNKYNTYDIFRFLFLILKKKINITVRVQNNWLLQERYPFEMGHLFPSGPYKVS